MYAYFHWDLFLLKTRVIFLTFFSLLHRFLIMNKEMHPWGRFSMVKSQLGEMLIWIPTKRAAPCLKNQTYGKCNFHSLIKTQDQDQVYTSIFGHEIIYQTYIKAIRKQIIETHMPFGKGEFSNKIITLKYSLIFLDSGFHISN